MSNSKNSPAEGAARTRTIKVQALARVEGEGGLQLEMVDGKCRTARLDIYEPPRFFEAFLRGRDFRLTSPHSLAAARPTCRSSR